METGRDNSSSADLRTGPATNVGELHQSSPLTEQGHGGTINSHLEAHPSALGNNPTPPSSLSSSQNPFLLPSDATNNSGNGGMMNNGSSNTYPTGSLGDTHLSSNVDMLGLHSSFSPSAYESSPGNPFQEPTNTNNKAPFESWQNQPSAYETVPKNGESHNTFPVTEQGHHSMVSSNLGTPFSSASESSSQEPTSKSQKDTNAPPKLGLDSHVAAESSDDDIPISSMPKHGQSGDVAGVQSSAAVTPGSNLEFDTNKGSEIQNPPVQVMERPGDSGSGTSSSYTFPSHVFARNNTNAPVEWSTASNESLFSIYMGNTSFSSELPYFGGKSAELDKPGDIYMPDQHNTSPSHQPPAAPVNKFNDISQRTAELHEEGSKVTEAKAAETMREVIMETSRTNENVGKGGAKSSNSQRQSDGSTKSFAFQSVSSKGAEEKQKQQKQSEQKETPNAVDQAPKSTTNAPPNKWLSCFACCTFCH